MAGCASIPGNHLSGIGQRAMIAIRRAHEADADSISSISAEIQALHARALPELFKPPEAFTFPADKVRELLNDPDWLVFVSELDAVVVGYVSAQIHRRAETPFRRSSVGLGVQWMGVRAAWRRQGVGRALIDAVKSTAAERGITSVFLDVWAFNTEAQSFYEALGFRPKRYILALDVSL